MEELCAEFKTSVRWDEEEWKLEILL